MHKHQWVVVTTQPAEPNAVDSVNLAKKCVMTAFCVDPECREKRILIPAFEIHPTGCMQDPAQKIPRTWELMTVKATDAELAAVAGIPTQEHLG